MKPDAILVSAEEPVARPLETAESLANSLPDTPIILYSSVSNAEAVRRGMVFGARDYLVKPLQGQAVRDAIFRALEQEERRQMRRAGQLAGESGRGTVIVVTGAKGGIGKSVAAVNLAVALRLETGQSVALIDADTQFGDAATLLDLNPEYTVAEVIREPGKFSRTGAAKYMTHHASGVDLLATSRDEDPWLKCTDETWSQILDTVTQLYEFVVIDTSGSFDAFVRRAIDGASLTLMVTTGEVSSVRDSVAALRRLANWEADVSRVRVVFNKGARAAGVAKKELEQALGMDVFWELPNDKAVPYSVQVGRPVAMDANNRQLGQSMRGLARLIAGTKRSLVEQPEQTSSLRRLISWRGRKDDTSVAAAAEPNIQR
jgi:pilus assembly protein CpaE